MRTTIFNDKYKFYDCQMFDAFELDEGTWSQHQFVSVNNMNEVIGYISYNIDRQAHYVFNFGIINFDDDKITFGADIKQVIHDIFYKFCFNKMSFFVVCGNPVEKEYDKLIDKYGGRIVGTYEKDVKLYDGTLYDRKSYEIMRCNFLQSGNRSKQ